MDVRASGLVPEQGPQCRHRVPETMHSRHEEPWADRGGAGCIEAGLSFSEGSASQGIRQSEERSRFEDGN